MGDLAKQMPQNRKRPSKAYAPRDPEVTSRIMSRVRSTGSKAERSLRQTLSSRRLRYRLHRRDLPGCPDIVFVSAAVAVFVDGDFWHARALKEGGPSELRAHIRGPRTDWWVHKLSRNAERDLVATAALRERGWTVLRFWESEILANAEACADTIERSVRSGLRKRREID